MAAGLAFGFVTGLANPESELVPGVLAAAGVDEEVIIVSDASASMFGAETPF